MMQINPLFQGATLPSVYTEGRRSGDEQPFLFTISSLRKLKKGFSNRNLLAHGLTFYKDLCCYLNFANDDQEEKTGDSSWGHCLFKGVPGNSCDIKISGHH